MAGFSAAVADDYKVFDDPETVTFAAVRAATTNYTITNAESADVTSREIASSGGFLQAGDRHYGLGNNQISVSGDKPRPGDHITDSDGVVWEILEATLDSLKISWACLCRKAR